MITAMPHTSMFLRLFYFKKIMSYSSKEEHDYYENGAAQAQAEYEQQQAYYEFLDKLLENKQYQLHAIYISLDVLNDSCNDNFKPAIDFLIDLKNKIETNNQTKKRNRQRAFLVKQLKTIDYGKQQISNGNTVTTRPNY